MFGPLKGFHGAPLLLLCVRALFVLSQLVGIWIFLPWVENQGKKGRVPAYVRSEKPLLKPYRSLSAQKTAHCPPFFHILANVLKMPGAHVVEAIFFTIELMSQRNKKCKHVFFRLNPIHVCGFPHKFRQKYQKISKYVTHQYFLDRNSGCCCTSPCKYFNIYCDVK